MNQIQTLFNALINQLTTLNIPIKNLIGFASDNASVMVDWLNGVKTKLENLNKNIFVLGCRWFDVSNF